MSFRINPFTGLPETVQDDALPAYEIAAGEAIRIPVRKENIVTTPQIVDGILIVDGRNTIL